ncbi:MAG: restriction endonuclease subunit S, partial [Mitsuokella sp.]|uniref:restriction endonuclease subunit S n=1 Tax=Mitsuokella sp. TaxID=2049034 RepID=UPI003EFE8E57
MKRKLGEVCTFYSGTGFPIVYQGKNKGELPFYKVGDIANNVIAGNVRLSLCNNYISYHDAKEIRGTIIPKDVVVFAKIGEAVKLNRRSLTSCDCLIDNNAMGIAPNKEVLRIKYFFYYMKHIKIQEYAKSTTVPSVRKSTLEEIEIDIPRIELQLQREGILDKISGIILSRKQELLKLDDLIKARFSELFGDLHINPKGWPIRSFNDIARIDTRMIRDFKGYESLPHIGIDSIEKDTGRLFGYRTVKEDGVISGKYLFSPKHIIYSKIRPNLNKVAMPNFEGVCSADAYPILVNEKECTREFLTYVMRSSIFLDYILTFSNRTNLPKVNKKQVEGFSCPVPPLDCQMKFKVFFNQINKSKSAIQKSLDETQTLFN